MEEAISLVKDNGELMTKEEFVKNLESIYDELAEAYEEECTPDSYLDEILENPISIEEVSETNSFHTRTVYLCEEITPELADAIFQMIAFWNQLDDMDDIPVEEREVIKLIINTPGGDLNGSLTIIDAIELSKTPVHTITIGTGYSGGFFIGICGHKRYGYPHSSYCFHEGSAADGGDAHKFLQKVEFYKKQLGVLKNITINHTLINEEDYNEKYKDDWFMLADEALNYGVIDEILTDRLI